MFLNITFKLKYSIFIVALLSILLPTIQAKDTIYNLTIKQSQINHTGKAVLGMTINGKSPGPVLHFKEGDTAIIKVHNEMNVDTSVHWHGLLVPPGMDGVPLISFPPIKPGEFFTYKFPIRQSGTYWYHSHTRLQEQAGVYGAIVIEPKQNNKIVNGDHVIVLSEWTDENPDEVLRMLKRGSEWFSIEKGSSQSIIGAGRSGYLKSYFKRELMRMPAMDISDISYDRFLSNGKPSSTLDAKPKDIIRLRIVNAGAGTNFFIEFAGGPMTIISSDGQDVEEIIVKRLFIAIAETYDVLIQIPDKGSYEFRATAHDGSGYSSTWIGTGKKHHAPNVPMPNLYKTMGHPTFKRVFALTPEGSMGMTNKDVKLGKFDKPGMGMMGKKMDMSGMDMKKMDMKGMKHKKMPAMDMKKMDMKSSMDKPHMAPSLRYGKKYGKNFSFLASDVSSNAVVVDGMDSRRPWSPYKQLRSIKPTAFSSKKPVREIRLTLDGDMERYVWMFNNKTLSEEHLINIKKNEIVRFIFINRTMMHHPMHLHGHFFRLINGQGDHSPLKHTVNVTPMSTTVIEFKANEFGDWFFHCHLLYHAKSGMARVVHYEGYDLDTINPQLEKIRPNLYKDAWYQWADIDLYTNMAEGMYMLSNTRNILSAELEIGWADVDDTEWEGIVTYDRYINRFLSVFAGIDLIGTKDDLDESNGVVGFRYLLPLSIESRSWIDSDGETRINLGKSFQITPRLDLYAEAQYDTLEHWEGKVKLSYLINKKVSFISQWHSRYEFGVGIQFRF